MSLIDEEYCKPCRYYDHTVMCCTYCIMENERRQCPAGKYCTRKIEGLRKGEAVSLVQKHKKRRFDEMAAWKLYEIDRLTDKAIGERLGVSLVTITKWRKANHYPCNYIAGGQKLANRPATKPPEIQGANT